LSLKLSQTLQNKIAIMLNSKGSTVLPRFLVALAMRIARAVDATHAITSVLRYMNKQDEVGARRGDWLRPQYTHIYDLVVQLM
jgi:hypothetical protein